MESGAAYRGKSFRNEFRMRNREMAQFQSKISAVYMRGGTSKGVFFHADDLPSNLQERDSTLLRIMGSPDPYCQQIDGMGAATSSTSKVVLISRSTRPDCDVDYLFGQVSIDQPLIDWTGNCGNLTAAVGPFAISEGLVQAPVDGAATIRIWQANIEKRIIAVVPMKESQVVELGDFVLDGVSFPAAEITLEFVDPGGQDSSSGSMFPTGTPQDDLEVSGVGRLRATCINAGNPTIFVAASSLGLRGSELQADVNQDSALLARIEAIRCCGAVTMGLADPTDDVSITRPGTPKVAFVAPPNSYLSSDGRTINARDIRLLARIVSMGRLHHAMTGTGAIALATAAAVPGTVVYEIATPGDATELRFGHPSGTMKVGARCEYRAGQWTVTSVLMSRSARRLISGWVHVPIG